MRSLLEDLLKELWLAQRVLLVVDVAEVDDLPGALGLARLRMLESHYLLLVLVVLKESSIQHGAVLVKSFFTLGFLIFEGSLEGNVIGPSCMHTMVPMLLELFHLHHAVVVRLDAVVAELRVDVLRFEVFRDLGTRVTHIERLSHNLVTIPSVLLFAVYPSHLEVRFLVWWVLDRSDDLVRHHVVIRLNSLQRVVAVTVLPTHVLLVQSLLLNVVRIKSLDKPFIIFFIVVFLKFLLRPF